ncbi:MAG: hypothetical protein AB1630_10225 [bacterium]
MKNKIYKRPGWTSFVILLFSILTGVMWFFLSFTIENKIERCFGFYIAWPLVIVCGFILSQAWKNYRIIIEDESITMIDWNLGKFQLGKPIFVQTRWENIIAICSVNYLFRRMTFIIPKPNPEDLNNVDNITSEVKLNRKEKIAKLYIDWLITNQKGIYICPTIKNYISLIRKILTKAPQAVVDEKIKRLIEK